MNPIFKISREKLYQEIWKNSVKGISDKYGLNYSKLCKSCHKNNIPIPSPKYWINLKMGRDVESLKVPLPESEKKYVYLEYKNISSNIISSRDVSKKSKNIDACDAKKITYYYNFDSSEIRHRLSGLNNDEKIEKIIDILKNWQPSTRKTLEKPILNYKKSVNKWKKEHKDSYHNRDYYYYEKDIKKPKYIDKVSAKSLPRLYQLLNLLAYTFKQLDEKITDDGSIIIGKDSVNFEVVEGQDKVPHELTKEDKKELAKYEEDKKKDYSWVSKPRIRKWDYPYNGKLRIRFVNYGIRIFIKDTVNQTLEQQLPKIVTYFYEAYITIRNERLEREKEERLQREAEERRKRQQELITQENNHLEKLYSMVDDYRLSKDIREMAKKLRQQGLEQAEVQWMLNKADWIDPIINKKDEMLGKRQRAKKDSDNSNRNNELWEFF